MQHHHLYSLPLYVQVYDRYCGIVYLDVTIIACDGGVAFPFTIDETHTNASNQNANNGAIDITVNGSTAGNYQYLWTNDLGQPISEEEDISGLDIGIYTVKVEDACGRKVTKTIEITSCDFFVSNNIVEPCRGLSNGAIDLYHPVSGGTPQLANTYQWSNGATTQDIDNLAAGTYSVTITSYLSSGACSAVYVVQLNNGPPDYDLVADVVDGCPGVGGSIDLTITGGTGPFTYEWHTGQTTQDISGLGFGNYMVSIYDGNGCKNTRIFGIGEREIIVDAQLKRPCTSNQNETSGGINLFVEDNGFGPYTFEWSNNQTTEDLTNLSVGIYTVTITDVDGCPDFHTYILEPQNSFQIEIADIENISYCSHNTCTGSVDLTIMGGTGPFTYKWYDSDNQLVRTTEDVNGLCEGYHTVVVTNSEGCEKTRDISICCCFSTSITHQDPGDPNSDYSDLCLGNPEEIPPITLISQGSIVSNPPEFYGNISISASGGTGSYYISWSTGDLNVSSLNNLSPGSYAVTVTDGCKTAEKDFTIYGCNEINGPELLTIESACANLDNGAINFMLPNPGAGLVSVSVDGINVPITSTTDPVNISTGNLSPGNHDINISIGSCDITFVQNIGSNPSEEFDEYSGDMCQYDIVCDGEILETNEYSPYRAYGEGKGGTGVSKCKVPIYCRDIFGTFIKDKKIKRRRVEGATYLNTIAAANISPGYRSTLRSTFVNKGYTVCSSIKYCPGSLEIQHFSSNSSLDGYNGYDQISAYCTLVDCVFGDAPFVTCTDNLPGLTIPDGGGGSGGGGGNTVPCSPRSERLSVLYDNKEEIANEYSDYYNDSELEELINDYGGNNEAYCAQILFCVPSLHVLSAPNMNYITCGPLGNPVPYQLSTGEFVYFTETCQPHFDPGLFGYHVLCYDDDELNNIRSGFLSEDYDPFINTDVEFRHKGIVDNYNSEVLHSFNFIKNQGVTIPKGMVTSNNISLYYDYGHLFPHVDKVEIPYLSKFIDDWDTEQTINVFQADDAEFFIEYEDSLQDWNRNLLATGSLDVSHLSKTDDKIFIGGTFSGQLSYFGTSVTGILESSAFLITLSREGTIISTNIIEHINGYSPLVFSENRDGSLYIGGGYLGNTISINGVTNTFTSDNGFFLLKAKEDNIVTPVSPTIVSLFKEITKFGNFRLLDLSLSNDQEAISLVVNGSGVLGTSGQNIFNNLSDHLSTITFSKNSNLAWAFSDESAFIDDDKFDFEYDEEGNLHYGITFTNTINLGDSTLTSAGQSDVCLMKVSKTGEILWTKQYGTSDDENVSALFCDLNSVYFGGVFNGATRNRRMGNYGFVNLTSNNQRSYISYIRTEDSVNSADPHEDVVENSDLEPFGLIYPNPFSSTFTVELNDSNIAKLEIVTSVDQKIMDINTKGQRVLKIDLKKNPQGIYIVKYFDSKDNLVGTQKIVKMN